MDEDDDAKAKSRIITHMNQDHRSTLSRFMEHYNRLPRGWTHDAQLEEVTKEHLILRSGTSRNLIALDPPLTTWSEARQRFIQMDQAALEGLGRSSIVIDRYIPPRGFHLVVFVLCIWTYSAFNRRANFESGSLLYDHLLYRVPSFAKFCTTIQPFLFAPMVLLHLTEAFWLDRTRLAKYNVFRFTTLWWLWILSSFVEGVGAKVRFDRAVEEKRMEKKKGGERKP